MSLVKSIRYVFVFMVSLVLLAGCQLVLKDESNKNVVAEVGEAITDIEFGVTFKMLGDINYSIATCSIFPALQEGLVLDESTCTISGTPTVAQVATGYTVRANTIDGAALYPTTFTLTVNDDELLSPPSIEDAEPVETYLGSPISITFVNTGGPISSCRVDKDLPEGLILENNCEITGEIQAVGGSDIYTVTGTNAAGSDTASVEIIIDDFEYPEEA
jgi:hypothetical protein